MSEEIPIPTAEQPERSPEDASLLAALDSAMRGDFRCKIAREVLRDDTPGDQEDLAWIGEVSDEGPECPEEETAACVSMLDEAYERDMRKHKKDTKKGVPELMMDCSLHPLEDID